MLSLRPRRVPFDRQIWNNTHFTSEREDVSLRQPSSPPRRHLQEKRSSATTEIPAPANDLPQPELGLAWTCGIWPVSREILKTAASD